MTDPAPTRPAPLAVGKWHCYVCPKCGAGISSPVQLTACPSVRRNGADCGAVLGKSAPTLIEAMARRWSPAALAALGVKTE